MSDTLSGILGFAKCSGHVITIITGNGYQMHGKVKRFDNDCVVIFDCNRHEDGKDVEAIVMLANVSTIYVPKTKTSVDISVKNK